MSAVRIVAISDLHGQLPDDLPECDLLLIGGDICPIVNHDLEYQRFWLKQEFKPWLKNVPAKHIVGTWGNHDWIGERPELVPSLPWHLLVDQGIELFGLRLFGSPWQPTFFDWAFNLDEPDLANKWALIPAGTDILLLHGPPYGYGDIAGGDNPGRAPKHTGSPSLTARILEVRPQLVVFGHIHEARGVYPFAEICMANVSLLDSHYQRVHAPFVTQLSPRSQSVDLNV